MAEVPEFDRKLTILERKQFFTQHLEAKKKNIHETTHGANFKFLLLFRTRLTEEGIPLADANIIANAVRYDFSMLNEDDDYLGDVALLYAEICATIYNALKTNRIIGLYDGDVREFSNLFTFDFLTI